MMRLRSLIVPAVLLAGSLSTTGCATMLVKTDPDAKRAGATGGAPIKLEGNVEGVTAFVDGKPANIIRIEDRTFGQAFRNSMAQEAAQQQANSSGITQHYTEKWWLVNAIYAEPGHQHTIKFVRGDKVGEVQVKPSMMWSWMWIDLFTTGPIGIAVDHTTGKWNKFPRIDVSGAMPGTEAEREADRMGWLARATAYAEDGYKARNTKYSDDRGKLGLRDLRPGFDLKLNEATAEGWSATMTRSERGGKSCVVYGGNVKSMPATKAERKQPSAAGEIVCDG